MTPGDLESILLKAKPFKPRALVLLRKHQAGEVESISQIDRMRAHTEMRAINQMVKTISEKIEELTPISLTNQTNEFVGGFYL